MSRPQAPTIHDWLYEIVAEVCHDREYLYRGFVEHFGALMQAIYRSRGGAGEYRLPGIKSPLQARVEWRLARQVSFMGPNTLSLRCRITEAGGGGPQPPAVESPWVSFDLSTGERAPQGPAATPP